MYSFGYTFASLKPNYSGIFVLKSQNVNKFENQPTIFTDSERIIELRLIEVDLLNRQYL